MISTVKNIIVINNLSCSHHSKAKLADLVAEHLDHLHYLNDILCLEIGDLNCVLTDQLLHRLLMPLYVLSLANRSTLSQDTLNQVRCQNNLSEQYF
jgi:hypothetical protein